MRRKATIVGTSAHRGASTAVTDVHEIVVFGREGVGLVIEPHLLEVQCHALGGLQEVGAAHRHHRREGRHGHRPDRGAVEEDDRRLTVDPLCVPYINVPVLFTRSPQ